MSRIGRMPIAVPAGVDVQINGTEITVKGEKGTLTGNYHPNIKVEMQDGEIIVTRPNDKKENRSLHGLTRSLIFNMVEGVTKGYTKNLEINGVGYRAALEGKTLNLTIGFSHPVLMTPPEGVTLELPTPNKIIVSGYDKQKVGQFAAEIRRVRPPEPYKGKGIKYEDEVIRRKEGKAGSV